MPYSLILGLAVGLSVLFFWIGRRAARPNIGLDDQLGRYLEDNPTSILQGAPSTVPAAPGFGQRVIGPSVRSLLNRLGALTPSRNVEMIGKRLETAGRPYGFTVLNFLGLKFMVGLLLAVLNFVLFGLLFQQPLAISLLLTVTSGLLGYFFPDLWLRSTVRSRQHQILRALPDALDMIVVCTEAGQSLDQALRRVGEYWHTPLTDEFNRILAEIVFGRTRHEALAAAAERIQLDEFSNLISAIIQAELLGVSTGKVLRVQADQLRTIRRQRAEELAHQASIKMLFPLVFLIFPAMLAVLLGPAIPLILETFANLGQ